MNHPIPILGAGLAGSEAAWQLAEAGIDVRLFEMRPHIQTPAHQTPLCAELVCSNSLGSVLPDRAAGLLQMELEALSCHLLEVAKSCAVPAGSALAVDRDTFAEKVTQDLKNHPRIEIVREEVQKVPEDAVSIVATGPLTSESLAADIQKLAGQEHLSFFDAIAPVVTVASLDTEIVFRASRREEGNGDYWNAPLNREEYEAFIASLLSASTHTPKEFETAHPEAPRFFERCLPIEILAARGDDSLRFGPMRPVGLTDPRTGEEPWAVLQMRQENLSGTLANLVGFQTHIRHGEQEALLRTIPGMSNAEFARLGSIHRNTFLDSPRLLEPTLEWRNQAGLFMAGQITGMEGYLGNIGSGLLAALGALSRINGTEPVPLPRTTLLGALALHVAKSPSGNFQPMKVQFGLLPPLLGKMGKAERRKKLIERSMDDLGTHRQNPSFPSTHVAPAD
ncbi:MAG TPA: methylenetetrahydrofolate--tRNA-(uracil(54)-C(5))-methyltransferase (FADH(2)-oxidizing) TrmFO [Planctomycetes bacterium]|nr:methylenetetrahydrofolate--tRNA-(uracil(54)-C(5))-methyltransferase (FADH(2)-oxidizing) TrmFO [Planctomycetota bacterium]